MLLPQKVFYWFFSQLKNSIFLLIIFSSCSIPIVRKAPAGKYYLRNNSIDSLESSGERFTKTEKSTILQRLYNQLDDSSKVPGKDVLIFFNVIRKPPVYDSIYTNISAKNMEASLVHLGYYQARVIPRTDTSGKKIHVHYVVKTGKPTLIDTVSYRLRKPGLQQIATGSARESQLRKYSPITKNAVIGEINRLVDSFRNNGYYKFTAAELKVLGDTSIEALTSVSDDPFEQLRLLAEAQQKADSPRIKLAVSLNPPADSTKLKKYYINRIYILSDYIPGDEMTDTTHIIQRNLNRFTLRYHEKLFRTGFLARNISFKSGDLYNQSEYYNTLSNLSQAGVWQSVNIKIAEVPGTDDKIDMIIELIPAKKFGFEAAVEVSYSANSNANNILGGNLFGISGNLSLTNRNVGKEAIRMTHKIRAGIELNNNSSNSNAINSNDVGYTNSVVFPKLILPGLLKFVSNPFSGKNRMNRLPKGETFINTNLTYNNRLELFNMQTVTVNFGWSWLSRNKIKWEIRPLYLGFSKLYNRTDSFNDILRNTPFLNYSYNDAFAVGMSAGFSNQYFNPIHPGSKLKERNIKFNVEESGLTWANIGILRKYLRRYIKFDAEYRYSVNYTKTALAFRMYAGVGIPLLGSDSNRTLPFFKQYYGGGSNSMRGWPLRGIGVGGKSMAAYGSNSGFNDRTGDIMIEGNAEFRYDIARIIPNTLTLRGALFVDAGNIWNLKSSIAGTEDSTQFKLKNFYKQLGVSAGTGFRLDFNYFILRFDFGFRFKRPELYYINDGWKAPSIGFDNFISRIFSANDRKWRYENFNFTVGISYPF